MTARSRDEFEERFKRGEPVQVSEAERAAVKEALAAGALDNLPGSLAAVLKRAAEVFVRGDGLVLGSVGEQLTTQRAADILNVSRQYLVRILDEGRLPHTKVGSHRRVRLDDVLAFRRERHEGFKRFIRTSDNILGEAEAKSMGSHSPRT